MGREYIKDMGRALYGATCEEDRGGRGLERGEGFNGGPV